MVQTPLFNLISIVFGSGLILLEMATMKRAKGLYEAEWPNILDSDICDALKICLSSTLATNPADRESFTSLLKILNDNEAAIWAMPLTAVKRD
jgi:hypothetical protein